MENQQPGSEVFSKEEQKSLREEIKKDAEWAIDLIQKNTDQEKDSNQN